MMSEMLVVTQAWLKTLAVIIGWLEMASDDGILVGDFGNNARDINCDEDVVRDYGTDKGRSREV